MRNDLISLLENFILYFTHSSQGDTYFKEEEDYTPKLINQCAEDYIGEDHVDGKGSEPTGKTYLFQTVKGVFSNSAVTDASCTYQLVDNNEYLAINVFPYSRNTKENWLESVYQTAKIKTPSGDIHEINTFCFKKGVLLYQKKEYAKMKKIVSEKGTYIFLLKYKGSYSESTYKFSFEM